MTQTILRATLLAALGLAAASAFGQAPPKTLDPKGQFHTVHTKKLQLACDSCHKPAAARSSDPYFLRADEVQGTARVNRELCLPCHREPMSPAWYGKAAK